MAAKVLKDLSEFQKSWDRLEAAVKVAVHGGKDDGVGNGPGGPMLVAAMVALQRPMDALEKAAKAVEKGK